MCKNIFSTFALFGLFSLIAILNPSEASAYVGPGPGMSFITTLIGFLVAIFTSLFVIVFYPIRKLMKRKKAKSNDTESVAKEAAVSEASTHEKSKAS